MSISNFIIKINFGIKEDILVDLGHFEREKVHFWWIFGLFSVFRQFSSYIRSLESNLDWSSEKKTEIISIGETTLRIFQCYFTLACTTLRFTHRFAQFKSFWHEKCWVLLTFLLLIEILTLFDVISSDTRKVFSEKKFSAAQIMNECSNRLLLSIFSEKIFRSK